MSSSSGGAIFRSARFTGRAESASTGHNASQVTIDATREAEALIARAQEEAEALRRVAYDEGFAEGRQAGYEDGLVAASQDHDQRVDEEVERLRAIADAAVVDRSEMLQSVESQAVRLAIVVARRIVKRELATDESAALRTVRLALKLAADSSTARIRLNPVDREFLAESHLPDLERGDRQCELVADETVERGGCVVECASGLVDAQIATQLADVEAALLG